jgi:Tol biopolymer transport system component
VLTTGSPEKTKSFPLISRDGTKVVYSINVTKDITQWDVYETDVSSGQQRRICEGCGPSLSLAADGQSFLAYRPDGTRSRINLVDISSGKETTLLQSAKLPIGSAAFSPNGSRVAFLVQNAVASNDVFVATLDGNHQIPEEKWIRVTSSPGDIRQVFWSPNGQLIYYDLTAAGSSYLMARRLDASGHPGEEAFRVHEFGRVRPNLYVIGGAGPIPPTAFSAVPGRFIAVLTELNSNIWMMNAPQ